MRREKLFLVIAGYSFFFVAPSLSKAQTVPGNMLALRSSGATAGSSWTLSTDGYVGTYIQLTQPTAVTFTTSASGVSSAGLMPDMTLAIADSKQSFNITSSSLSNYNYTTPALPAGTYFIRTQLDNQNATAHPTLTVGSLTVSGTGVSVLNSSTDANALASANTYIDNFRKGNAGITFTTADHNPLAANTSVQVNLSRIAFDFGTNVPGNSQADVNSYLGANPTPGSQADNFQQFINTHFNSVVPSNYGKWANDEATQNVLTMGPSDQVLAYAKAHNMTARMHNLIWGNQQPTWVNTLLTNAQSSTPATAAAAKASLSTAIANRIAYYIGGTTTGSTDKRAQDFIEMDGLNESLHTGPYWKIFGASGIASIYSQAQQAITAAGGHAGVYLNEFNVFQNSPASINTNVAAGSNPVQSGSDPYANWYRQNVEDLNNAGFGKVVTGIGVQYYPTASGPAHSPAVINEAMQNLAVEGLPITLTEFGVQSTEPTTAAPGILEDSMRMMFGSPDATGFYSWGWWAGATSSLDSSGVMVNTTWKNADGSWNLTPTGTRYEWLFGQNTDSVTGGHNGVNPDPWTTNLSLATDANGQVNFNGFYGNYNVTVNGQTYGVNLVKGANSQFNLVLIANGWNLAGGGSFNTASNWSSNAVPNGVGVEADFLSAITADSTVFADTDVTLGKIVFDNTHGYVLTGAGTLTMQTSSGSAVIDVETGTQKVNLPLTIASNTTLNVKSGSTLKLSDPVTVNAGASLTQTGPGTVTYESTVTVLGGGSAIFTGGSHATGLTLMSNAAASVSSHSGATPTLVQFDSLSLAGGSAFDLGNNELLTSAALSSVRGNIIAGRLVTSSTGGTLGSRDLGNGTTEVLFTLSGDTDLNGKVDVADLGNLASNFGEPGAMVWDQGDFNYDGSVNVADLGALASNYGESLASSPAAESAATAASVPEPGTFAALGAIGFLSFAKRWGRHSCLPCSTVLGRTFPG